jgi:putative nucleotidyltransferase with HDIG domain
MLPLEPPLTVTMPALTLADAIAAAQRLPSLPAAVAEVIANIDQDDINLETLADKISCDQALTARILRLANSSFYGQPKSIATIPRAISVLGLRSVRTLSIAAAVTGQFAGLRSADFDFLAFWRHSLGTALHARALAAHAGFNPDAAFTAGLLHDIGHMILLTRFPEVFSAVLAYRKQHQCGILVAERVILGFDHTAIGAAVVAHWRFPTSICEVVGQHHDERDGQPLSLSTIVRLCNETASPWDTEEPHGPPPGAAEAQAFGLDEATWRTLLDRAVGQLDEICSILTAH